MASQPIYQFYAELSDYKPKIWRRFQVLDNITMARLGYIIMTMFEMQASHLFCFDFPFDEYFKREMLKEFTEEEMNRALIGADFINSKIKTRYLSSLKYIDEKLPLENRFYDFKEYSINIFYTLLSLYSSFP